MRSLSEEGRDNITHPERGPLGTGGDALAGDPHTVAGYSVLSRAASKDGVNAGSFGRMAGSVLTPVVLRKAPFRTVRCLMLEAVLWENPTYGILGRAAGNVVYGGTAHPPATERAGSDKPPPTDARASALPDSGRRRQAGWNGN